MMLKKLAILSVSVLCLAVVASATEAPNPQPPQNIQFGADAATILGIDQAPGQVHAAADKGSDFAGCSASATCRDGSTISCSSSGSSTSCSSSDHNCPTTQGFVRCGRFTRYCSASCPASNCPIRQGCQYVFIIADGCCVDTLNQPGYYCPDICQ